MIILPFGPIKLLICAAAALLLLVPPIVMISSTSRHHHNHRSLLSPSRHHRSPRRAHHRLLNSGGTGSTVTNGIIDLVTAADHTDQHQQSAGCAVVPPPLWCGCDRLETECGTAQQCRAYTGAIRNEPLHITLLYEGLCPDCQSFITSTLFDVYQKFKAHIRIEFVPFGNARVLENGTIKCQHGPEECRINKFHSCAIHFMHDPMPFIYCLEKLISSGIALEKASKKCYAKLHPVPHIYDQITHCFNGPTGDRVQKEAAKRTASIWPDQHEFVPWILVNNASLQSTQFLMNGLPTLICLSRVGIGDNEAIPGLTKILKAGSNLPNPMKKEDNNSNNGISSSTTTTNAVVIPATAEQSAVDGDQDNNDASSDASSIGGPIIANERQKEQRKSLDALYAAAREEFDLDMSPLDSAMKTLREGREIQKLSVLRNLVELVEGEPDDALHRLLPMMQEILSVEPSNLDMHCEAAVAYKNCIKEKKLQQKCPELSDRFLVAILENIEAQKENVTATAWLESLVDIADCVSMQSVINMVVPLAVAQADSGKRVQRRVISTRLIEKLAVLVPKEILQRELSPCAQMLCQDPNAAVRTSIAQKLSVLAQSLNSSTDCCALLLPCIIQLCKDEDPSVREAILSAMAMCLPHFSKEAKKSVLLPLLRKCTEQALILRDASLPIVSRHFGSWLQCLRDILTPAEQRWWLDTFVRILDFSWQHNANIIQRQQPQAAQKHQVENGTPTTTCNGPQQKQQQLCVACRRMCAYNFPCFVAVFGDETDVFSGRLLPILEQLCRDSDDEVRSIIASGFHEIVAQRKMMATKAKTTTATTKNGAKNNSSISAPVPLLLGPFVDLLSSGNSDIVQQLTANLHRILPMLYAEISASGSKRRTHLIFAKLDTILVNCNNLMKGSSGSWRAHEAYLNGIAVLRNLVRPKDLLSNFVPLLQQEVLTARALPCRIAAAQTLLLMMREFATSRARQTIIDFFVHDIGQHPSCYRRRIMLDIVPLLLQYFSREFFIDKFLSAVLRLCTDPISNIRLQLCRTLPTIKQYLVFPNNDESLSSLERVVRELLASEQNALSRQLIQQSACELSRTEMDKRECRSNRAKLVEEKRLWTEAEEESADEEADEQRQPERCRRAINNKKYATTATNTTNGITAAGSSPESGIFFEEDCWLGTGGMMMVGGNNGTASARALPPHSGRRYQPGGLCRSATTTCIPQQMEEAVEARSNLAIVPSASTEMLSAMAIEPFAASSPKASRRRPPPPPPKSWRTTTTIRSTNGPKLAIVRPQPQVKVVNQRSCSPMPFDVDERKTPTNGNKLIETAPSKPRTTTAAVIAATADPGDQSDGDRCSRGDKASTSESNRKSRLPLSTTGRYRSSSSAPIPPPKPKLALFTSSGPPPPSSPHTTAGESGTTSVMDSVKLKKYRPRDITTTTTMTTRKCSLPGSSMATTLTNGDQAASSSSSYSIGTSRGPPTRSASVVPAGSSDAAGGITVRSCSPAASRMVGRSASPAAAAMAAVPLQTSSSVTSVPNAGSRSSGGGTMATRSVVTAGAAPRRPYGLMRVQSSSSAVERRPAQMSIKVVNLT